ncbi:MAG: ABC transporter permease [Bacillota bacterium]
MFLIRLALKNLKRHKKRTLITAMIIAFAVFFYLFLDSMMIGMRNKSFENIINFESGHIQIANEDYWDDREEFPLDNLLSKDNNEIIEEVEKIEGFKGISPQLKFTARLNNGVDELPVPVRAIIPDKENKVFDTEDYILKGDYFKEDENGAVIGKELADLMELEKGDYFTLVFRTKEETFNTLDLEITALINTPNPNINSNRIFIPLSIAQDALNVENGISQYAVRLENNYVEEEIKNINEGLKEGVKAFSWRESASSMINLSRAQKAESQIILGIILLIAVLGIVNTIILAGIERLEEIGMMKALGMSEKEIILTFIYESTGIGIIGSLIGMLFGFISVGLFTKYGIDFFRFLGENDLDTFGMPMSGRIYGEWNLHSFIFIFFFVTIISSIISVFPAIWAAKKDVVKAIHHKH